MLKHPRIFLFDEATSSLDSHTELAIQQNLTAVSRHTTTLIVAHRLSTIRDADLILVMEDGQIVEQGNHHELLELGRAYAQLYESQFSGPDKPEELPQPSGDGAPTPR